MIRSCVEPWTLASEIAVSWSSESMATALTNVDKLIFGVEGERR